MPRSLSPSLSPRTKFALMFLFFATPFVISYLAFFFWKPSSTGNHGELIAPVIALPPERFTIIDGKDAPPNAHEKALRGKWLLVTRDSGACTEACEKKLYAMRQTRTILGREMTRVARVVLVDDRATPSEALQKNYAGTAWVAAENSAWLAKLPRVAGDATEGRGYFYAVDPMGNLFMRYKADIDIKLMSADFRRVLKASQLGKEFEGSNVK